MTHHSKLVFVLSWTAFTALSSAQLLHESGMILAEDRAEHDFFGVAVAMADGIVAVGAPGDDAQGDSSGSAYLFDASTGIQIAKLVPSDGSPDENFGTKIALGDGVVAVGMSRDDDNGAYSGSAYLFDSLTGLQIAKLLPSDGSTRDFFGASIAVSDGVVAIGAQGDDDNGTDSGAVYLFDAQTGSQQIKLVPDDGSGNDLFGVSVAIADGIVAVGAPGDGANGFNSGSAYLFDAETGAQISKLVPDDGNSHALFGRHIAINAGTVVVCATGDNDNGTDSGSAYIFDVATAAQKAKLLPNDGNRNNYFGSSVAIAGGVVAISASSNGSFGSLPGSVYLFDLHTSSQVGKLQPEQIGSGLLFGRSVAVTDGVVVAGASGYDDGSLLNVGSSFLFDLSPCSAADLAFPPSTLNINDVLTFLTAFADTAPPADLAEPFGVHDFDDVLAFLTAFGQGCP